MLARLSRILVVVLALIHGSSAAIAGAGDDDVLAMALAMYHAAIDADEASDPGAAAHYARAYDTLLPLAEGGEAEAQYVVAQMLQWGLGRSADLDTALNWYVRAGLKGHRKARTAVGYLLAKGSGTRHPEEEKARCWFEAAASQGDAMAQYNLGQLVGLFERPSPSQWLTRSAAQGYIPAVSLLGRSMLGNPLDTEKSRALMLLIVAEMAGDELASERLAEIRRTNPDSQSLERAKELAGEWQPVPETVPTPPPPIADNCLP